MGVPQNRWFTMETHLQRDNLGASTVDGCEILHQLTVSFSHDFVWLSTILWMVQDFATIHSMLQDAAPQWYERWFVNQMKIILSYLP